MFESELNNISEYVSVILDILDQLHSARDGPTINSQFMRLC